MRAFQPVSRSPLRPGAVVAVALSWPHVLARAVCAGIRCLVIWRARMIERDDLRDMNDRLLADVGLKREDVTREIAKPFWRA